MSAITPCPPVFPAGGLSRMDSPLNGIKVAFVGGPRAGTSRVYPRNPRTIGCVTEAHAKGMHGVYKTPLETWKEAGLTSVTATWCELPRRKP